MTDEQWNDPHNKSMAVKFVSPHKNEPAILVLLNASHVPVATQMPCTEMHHWKPLLNTLLKTQTAISKTSLQLEPRSVYVYEGEPVKS